jgi:DNA-3-methyladenine glycosylase II
MNAIQHLTQADSKLAFVIEQVGALEERRPPFQSHYAALARIIVGQQLSTRVAQSIWARVVERFGAEPIPEAVLAVSVEELRTLGLSAAKARYLHALAEHMPGGHLHVEDVSTASDEKIAAAVTAVKGLGPWSADIFLMFHLGRPDVIPVGDLGIREAVRRLYELEERPSAAELIAISEPWRPYRTLASRYLWNWLDIAPIVKEAGPAT